MRFKDFFSAQSRPIISFELFPPKTDAALTQLHRILPELIELRPSFMTVTYGALGSTRERTLEIASLIKREYQVETACHLTCVGSSRADLDQILRDFYGANIENIVALRGDPPKGEAEFRPPADGYAHANQLVEHIHDFCQRQGIVDFGIAVAGYPEKHIEAPDLATDLANLKRKVDAGADIVITQLFYDNSDYYRFVDEARRVGVSQPIVPGLLPILSAKQIRRITSLCGSRIPEELHAQLDAADDDDAKAEQIGIRQCVQQAKDLLLRGVPGIHFYVLNKSNHMKQIMSELQPVIDQLRGGNTPRHGVAS
ncbi:MAG: methylenetetrahydrofolate reductase [Gemmatales bacterium]|nr:MAG: methylenetetrahydrofolate reductase [Gemmatales bacterium]